MIPKLNILKEHRFKLVEDEHLGAYIKWSSYTSGLLEILVVEKSVDVDDLFC